MSVRRGIALVVTMIMLACLVSVTGVLILYLLFTREPAVPSRATLVVRLSGDLADGGPDDGVSLLGGGRRQTVRAIVENLQKARRDSRIAGVLVVPLGLQTPYWAKLQEVRDALIAFQKSGKPATAFLEYGGQQEYFVATGCSRVFLVPSSPLDLSGLAMYEVFLRGTFDKVGAVADMVHVGDYKTATNLYTQKGFTPAHREMDASLVADLYGQLVDAVAQGRKKSPGEVRALLDQGPFLPEQALHAGLVDDLAYEDQVEERLKSAPRQPRIELDDYARVSGSAFGLGTGPRIAVLHASGLIASGRSGYDPTSGLVTGSDTLIESIRRIRDDASIRAVVLRIDSPGGSSVASDVIWRELVVARDRKRSRPLVASMSDLAASGGYYIAVAAPTIVAEPGTLTGSIGIYSGKFVVGDALGKLGITNDAVSEGRNAEMTSPFKVFTPEQRAKLEQQMQVFYEQFVEKVAQSRRLTADRVDALGQGRVWTGLQARQLGLVDELGGLDRAIALAKQAARIPAGADVEIVSYPPARSLLDVITSQFFSAQQSRSLGTLAALAGDRSLALLAAPALLFRGGEPLALMPRGWR